MGVRVRPGAAGRWTRFDGRVRAWNRFDPRRCQKRPGLTRDRPGLASRGRGTAAPPRCGRENGVGMGLGSRWFHTT